MNEAIEKRFIKQFIIRNRQDRLLAELTSRDKRSKGICRFCHRSDELLRMDRIRFRGKNLCEDELARLHKKHCVEDACYLIAYADYLDGQTLPWHEAWASIYGNGMPAIMVFDRFAVIETEQEQGPAVKYVLSL